MKQWYLPICGTYTHSHVIEEGMNVHWLWFCNESILVGLAWYTYLDKPLGVVVNVPDY